MTPESGLAWQGISSGADRLFFPSMTHSAGQGGLLIVVSGHASQDGSGEEFYSVAFDRVEAFWAIEDRYYGLLGGAVDTGSVVNVTDQSAALSRMDAFASEKLKHYALLGGFMQYEVLSPQDPIIVRHENEAAAVKAAQEVLQ